MISLTGWFKLSLMLLRALLSLDSTAIRASQRHGRRSTSAWCSLQHTTRASLTSRSMFTPLQLALRSTSLQEPATSVALTMLSLLSTHRATLPSHHPLRFLALHIPTGRRFLGESTSTHTLSTSSRFVVGSEAFCMLIRHCHRIASGDLTMSRRQNSTSMIV